MNFAISRFWESSVSHSYQPPHWYSPLCSQDMFEEALISAWEAISQIARDPLKGFGCQTRDIKLGSCQCGAHAGPEALANALREPRRLFSVIVKAFKGVWQLISQPESQKVGVFRLLVSCCVYWITLSSELLAPISPLTLTVSKIF